MKADIPVDFGRIAKTSRHDPAFRTKELRETLAGQTL
jgi:hypothetical protein